MLECLGARPHTVPMNFKQTIVHNTAYYCLYVQIRNISHFEAFYVEYTHKILCDNTASTWAAINVYT